MRVRSRAPVLPAGGSLAVDRHRFGIDDVDQAGNRSSEDLSGVAEDRLCCSISPVRGGVEIADRLVGGQNALVECRGDQRAIADDRFEATAVAAHAFRAVRIDRCVAEFAGVSVRASVHHIIGHDRRSDAGSDGDDQEVAVVAASAVEAIGLPCSPEPHSVGFEVPPRCRRLGYLVRAGSGWMLSASS